MAKKDFLKGAAVGVILTAAVALGGFTAWVRENTPAKNTVLSDKGTRDKLEYLETLIDAKYMDEKDEEKLEEGLYAGLIYGLGDTYSRYYTAEEYEQESTGNAGSYVGIGVLIMQNSDGGILVTECYEGGPAELAGIEDGDVISAVDGIDITEMTTEEV